MFDKRLAIIIMFGVRPSLASLYTTADVACAGRTMLDDAQVDFDGQREDMRKLREEGVGCSCIGFGGYGGSGECVGESYALLSLLRRKVDDDSMIGFCFSLLRWCFKFCAVAIDVLGSYLQLGERLGRNGFKTITILHKGNEINWMILG